MQRRTFLKTAPAFTVLAHTASSFAKDLQPITLVKPQIDGGKTVLAALWERKTNRNISVKNREETCTILRIPTKQHEQGQNNASSRYCRPRYSTRHTLSH